MADMLKIDFEVSCRQCPCGAFNPWVEGSSPTGRTVSWNPVPASAGAGFSVDAPLLSGDSDIMTGENLVVDGEMVATLQGTQVDS